MGDFPKSGHIWGSLLKQNHPWGVINVVKTLDSFVSDTYQKPLYTSSLLKTFAPFNRASVTSTFGMGCTSLITFSFSGFNSTHIWTDPVGLGSTSSRLIHLGYHSYALQKNYGLTLKVKERITVAFHHYLKTDCYTQTHIKRQKFSIIIFHLFSVTKHLYPSTLEDYYFRHCSKSLLTYVE